MSKYRTFGARADELARAAFKKVMDASQRLADAESKARAHLLLLARSRNVESLIATGHSVQVFMDKNYKLVLYSPKFYEEWQKRWNVFEK